MIEGRIRGDCIQMKIKLKKGRMTRDERWLALLNRQPLDRIPVFGFAA